MPGSNTAGRTAGTGSITYDPAQVASFQKELEGTFPWLAQLGLGTSFFQELLATSASDSEVLANLRNTTQYKQRFPGLYRSDGSMRMNEAEYLSREGDYRQLLQQYGFGDRFDQSNPASLVGLFDGDIDPNELKQRLQTYQSIETGGQAQKDAFYVYAGMNVSTDDLYSALVDPAAAQRLTDEYNANIAKSQFDYTTWISRATQVGLDRVAKTLGDLQTRGAVTGDAIQNVLRTDPNFARQIMDALYHGGNPTGGDYLNLEELLQSFEYAAIGSAATQAGLSLPDRARIAEIRSAGIDRARATQLYSQYGANSGVYGEAVRRSGNGAFDQSAFENAAFLGNSADQTRLAVGLAREDAAGKSQGFTRFDEDGSGRLNQRGLRGY